VAFVVKLGRSGPGKSGKLKTKGLYQRLGRLIEIVGADPGKHGAEE
jgi:hypothetical protein